MGSPDAFFIAPRHFHCRECHATTFIDAESPKATRARTRLLKPVPTEAERRILDHLIGKRNKLIARDMGIAKGTVKARIKQHYMHDKGVRRMLAVDRLGSKKRNRHKTVTVNQYRSDR